MTLQPFRAHYRYRGREITLATVWEGEVKTFFVDTSDREVPYFSARDFKADVALDAVVGKIDEWGNATEADEALFAVGGWVIPKHLKGA